MSAALAVIGPHHRIVEAYLDARARGEWPQGTALRPLRVLYQARVDLLTRHQQLERYRATQAVEANQKARDLGRLRAAASRFTPEELESFRRFRAAKRADLNCPPRGRPSETSRVLRKMRDQHGDVRAQLLVEIANSEALPGEGYVT